VTSHHLLGWSEGRQQILVRRAEEWLAQQLSFVASVGRHLEQLVIPGSAWSVGKTAFASMQRGQRGNLTSIPKASVREAGQRCPPSASKLRLWGYQAEGNLLFVLPLPRWQVERGFAMAKGTIKKLISDKGFGFILTEEGKDLFFHRSQLQGLEYSSLKEGQEVEYEAGTGRGGRPEAAKVKVPSPKTE
jgi:CspA family cold shock protein